MFNGLIINPAYAGMDEALSLTIANRMQWTGVDGAPVTQTFSGHTLFKNKHMGTGLSLVNDKIGVHNNFSAMGSYAYHISFNKSVRLSFGFQAGIHNNKSDYSSLAASSGNDPLVGTSGLSQTSFDVGAGIYFRTSRLHIGLSAPQILSENSVVNDTMTVHWRRINYLLFSKYRVHLNNVIDLEPCVLVKYFPGNPISFDLNMNIVAFDAVTLGLSYRKDESVDFLFRGKITQQIQFGYAYDYPIGDVPKAGNGSHEIVINYRFKFVYDKVVSPR
jgi:type IX secretion system PorP/SprF family membrane protein